MVRRMSSYPNNDGIPANSFIAVSDYQTDDELARHLELVRRNDTEFLKYFEWTKYYRKPSSYVDDAACRLCADLHGRKQLHVKNIQEENSFDLQCNNKEC